MFVENLHPIWNTSSDLSKYILHIMAVVLLWNVCLSFKYPIIIIPFLDQKFPFGLVSLIRDVFPAAAT